MQAWQLVEKAGFRGAVSGDAFVAPEHSNWIVNNGSATAADIKGLILNIQTGVEMKVGVHLEREVLFVPEDIL
jgi:UDP-N-acetylmuramate dehydrogenase